MTDSLQAKLREIIHEVDGHHNTWNIQARDVDEAIDQIEQAFASESNTFDNYLRQYIPHDGKFRHVEFNVAINPDDTIKFKERNLMTDQEWYERFMDEYEKQYEDLVARPMDAITYIDTVKAAFTAARLAGGFAD